MTNSDDSKNGDSGLGLDHPFSHWIKDQQSQNFNGHVGPYYYQTEENRVTKIGFIPKAHHLNGGGTVHGGCLMTLADTSLFVFCMHLLQGDGVVTLSFDAQFLAPGKIDRPIIAEGGVTRAGRSVIFARGQLLSQGHVLLTYSGILKRLKASGGAMGDS